MRYRYEEQQNVNPIELTFVAVRLRTKVTKGRGSRAAGLPMAFKLLEAAPRTAGARSMVRISSRSSVTIPRPEATNHVTG
jgi:hypothetical protein